MNALAPFPTTTSGMSWRERVEVAKANPSLAQVLISIVLNEADRRGDSKMVDAAQACLDTMPDDFAGCFEPLDELFAEADLDERLAGLAAWYPGGELPDDVFYSVRGAA